MSHSELRRGHWNPSEKTKLQIDVLELKAVQIAIQSLTNTNRTFILTSNRTTQQLFAYLNKMGGGRRSELL